MTLNQQVSETANRHGIERIKVLEFLAAILKAEHPDDFDSLLEKAASDVKRTEKL